MNVSLSDDQWATCVVGATRRAAKRLPPSASLWGAVAAVKALLPLVEIDGLPIPGLHLGCCEYVHLIFARRRAYALFVSIGADVVRIQRFEAGVQTLVVETEGEYRLDLLRTYLDTLKD
ncbi:hypothetical protein AB1L88_15815 [Tautonia sp. JC769]|uniref:hypothetical protein n=1 Tax=Tautonia sp. JC769 TaxID=3232135 RepID=UPI003459A4A0